MSEPRGSLAIGLCNAGIADLSVWLEPWCDEFAVPPKSELWLQIECQGGEAEEPELEITQFGLTVYGGGNTRVLVSIDGQKQDTGSAEITAPDCGPLSTRGFVDLVFSDFADARPGGRPVPVKRNWFRRLFLGT